MLDGHQILNHCTFCDSTVLENIHQGSKHENHNSLLKVGKVLMAINTAFLFVIITTILICCLHLFQFIKVFKYAFIAFVDGYVVRADASLHNFTRYICK
jgi:hypothetical protein